MLLVGVVDCPGGPVGEVAFDGEIVGVGPDVDKLLSDEVVD